MCLYTNLTHIHTQMHIWWLPLGANTSSYSHVLTMIPLSLMSPLFLWIKFRISWISYFVYFISYNLRVGLKFYLFLLYLEMYPSWPALIPWMLALAKLSFRTWAGPSRVQAVWILWLAAPGMLIPQTLKEGHWESLGAFSVRLWHSNSHMHMHYFFQSSLEVPDSLQTQNLQLSRYTHRVSLWTSQYNFQERTPSSSHR